jgi:predicted nucleotidyltransferase
MKNSDLNKIKASIEKWANNIQTIRAIWFFGSRIKETNRDDSDLDVAIELIYTDPDSALAHWMFDKDKWLKEIQEFSMISIDLQWHHPKATPTIAQGIHETSIKIFERKSNYSSQPTAYGGG